LSEVTVKVRVPEDAFPTISTVPGAMISFRYYVEVVVDIQGKLGPQERIMAGLTGAAATAMSGGDDLENERGGMGAGGTYMVDTAPVRRDKGVVSATFEVVIGTRDSERRKGKQKEEEKPVVIQEPPVAVIGRTPAIRPMMTIGDIIITTGVMTIPTATAMVIGITTRALGISHLRSQCLTYQTTHSSQRKSLQGELKSACFRVSLQEWSSRLSRAHMNQQLPIYQASMSHSCV
jgi:hypothetical protein